jgi:biopolymer transport protein ExbB
MSAISRAACVLLIVAALPAPGRADDLDKAYKKEFAFLEAERQALVARLAELDEEAARGVAAARGEVEALQRHVLELGAQAEQLEEDLAEVEERGTAAEEKTDLLMETMSRASDALRRHGYEVSEPSADADVQATQILNLFKVASEVMERGGTLRAGTRDFFLVDGSRTTGQVVEIGNVAAYGVAERGGGALAPAGGERYKVWHQSAYQTAVDLVNGKHPQELEIFLYESMEKGVEETKEQTILEHIDSGGVIAWVIMGIGVVALLMIFARIVILLGAGSRTDKLLAAVGPLVDEGQNDAAIAVLQRAKGAAARVLKVTIRNLDRDRQHLEDLISEAILHEAPTVERFGTTILVIAAVAPLLGLLGTVTGMITTFDIITEFGTGDPKLLSGGISVALVTTEVGLVVAIPALLVGTLLSGGASSIMEEMERAALQIMNRADAFKARGKGNGRSEDAGSQASHAETDRGAIDGATA